MSDSQSGSRDRAELAEARWLAAFDRSPVGMAELTLDGRLIATNSHMRQVMGISATSTETYSMQDLVHPEDANDFATWFGSFTEFRGEGEIITTRFMNASGLVTWLELHFVPMPSVDGKARSLLAHFLNVTHQRHLESEVGLLLDHDPLTGLVSRSSLQEELDRQITGLPQGASNALIALDVDDFTALNDTFGGSVGDDVLVTIARVLEDRLRGTDVISRTRDHKFAVLLPGDDQSQAETVAEALVRDIRNRVTIPVEGKLHQISVSAGVVVATSSSIAENILADAFAAAKAAQRAGGNRFVVHEETAEVEGTQNFSVQMSKKLDLDHLVLLAQPIVEIDSGRVNRYELFLRLKGSDGKLVPAATFLPEVERQGRVGRLDRWVVQHAIDFIAHHPQDDVNLHINMSGRSLGDPHLMVFIESQIRKAKIDPGRLVFEVSEAAAMLKVAFATEFSEYLARIGCQFAVDHVGSDGGGLRYLTVLPFDFLKIEREFVSTCLTNTADRLVIEAIVSIAKGLSKQTIACSVEDKGTLALLKRAGVDFAQGFYFGNPEPLADSSQIDSADLNN